MNREFTSKMSTKSKVHYAPDIEVHTVPQTVQHLFMPLCGLLDGHNRTEKALQRAEFHVGTDQRIL